METGRTTIDDDNALGSRVLAVAMGACTLLGLVVAIGLTLRTNLDAPPPRPVAATPSAGAPAPIYQVGGDCSAGGISAQWDLRDGQLNCVARDRIPTAHRVGDDCSHDGIAANWQFPEGRWTCIPAATVQAPPPPEPGPLPEPEPAPQPAPAPQPEPSYVPPVQQETWVAPPAEAYEPTYEPPAPAPAPAPVPAPAPPPVPWLPQLPPLPWMPQPPR
ncbi:hypothetical protein [Nocardia bovistercoris]|uniref:Uncharacterized protein n=1 Tax=Nocardia bovistercoris TaxID=2785916 RepID=A0A931N389_9NOCA|nr:hypothetical protein [Nocardia bovistercoris]MBH0776886.1 hypothetical protein [Nocardia bovistercoris]